MDSYRSHGVLLAGLLALTLAGCDQAEFGAAKDVIRSMVKDPESAQFSQLYLSRKSDHLSATCGLVNAKNSFGGYVGKKRFVVINELGIGFFEIEDVKVDDVDGSVMNSMFQSTWSEYNCQLGSK